MTQHAMRERACVSSLAVRGGWAKWPPQWAVEGSVPSVANHPIIKVLNLHCFRRLVGQGGTTWQRHERNQKEGHLKPLHDDP